MIFYNTVHYIIIVIANMPILQSPNELQPVSLCSIVKYMSLWAHGFRNYDWY